MKFQQIISTAILALSAQITTALPATEPKELQVETSKDGNVTISAGGITWFTGDGYYHADCTGHKYWSYEVSQMSSRAKLNTDEKIGSIWIHHYGYCPRSNIVIVQYSQQNQVGHLTEMGVTLGTCLPLYNDGWGVRSVLMLCENV